MAFIDYLWIFRIIKAIIEALLAMDPDEADARGLIGPRKKDERKPAE